MEFFTKKVVADIFGLKWLRFFLGLNTILPSNNYEIWNNPYGWWTMSAFIWFYAMAPFLMKFVNNWKKAVLFVPVSLGSWITWKLIMRVLFGNINGLDDINTLSGASPFGTLIYFALGILEFMAIKEKKNFFTVIGLFVFAIVGVVIHRNAWTVAAFSGILIILFNQYPVVLKGRFKSIVQFFGKHSFNIYLVHLLAFEISWKIVSSLFDRSVLYLMWVLSSVVLIALLAGMLNFITSKILALCK